MVDSTRSPDSFADDLGATPAAGPSGAAPPPAQPARATTGSRLAGTRLLSEATEVLALTGREVRVRDDAITVSPVLHYKVGKPYHLP